MKDLSQVVEKALREHPDSRDSDFRMIGWVLAMTRPEVMNLPLKRVLWQYKELDLPSFETIRRTRQKLQHDKPELRGKSYEKRMEKQNEYIRKFAN